MRGIRTIKIRKFVNDEWIFSTIDNVLYVPKLQKNLFSVGVCAARGYYVTFSKGRVVISKHGKIVAECAKQAIDIYQMFFVMPPVRGDCTTEINVSESLADLRF